MIFDRSENGELSAELTKILSECQQEVPDFLQDGAGAMGGAAATGFGGVDIRGGNTATIEDDEW